MLVGAWFRRNQGFRWRFLFSVWSLVILAVIASAVVVESTIEERLLDLAHREVLAHTADQPHRVAVQSDSDSTRLGEAWSLIRLLHALVMLIGLGFCIAALVAARQLTNSVRRPIERLSSLLERQQGQEHQACANGDGRRLTDETSQLEEHTGQLPEAYLDMDSLDRVKDAFLSNLSHELRTPLTSILAAEEILSNFGDEDPMTRREFLDIIHQESTHLLGLIGKLLDLAKLEAKALQLQYEEVDLGALVDEIAAAAQLDAEAQHVTVSVWQADSPALCTCDRERIERVVHSMLECAIRCSPYDSQVRVTVKHDADTIVISVTDEGADPTNRFTDMFESRTEQSDTTRQRPFLGHPIARRLAQMHGGTLEPATSGTTTTVVLRLPTRPPAASQTASLLADTTAGMTLGA